MKKGFTLAETLVALAIIGVIAGIMIPAVNKIRPNREMVMLKKAYYTLGKTVYELVNDEVLYPETADPARDGFRNTANVPFRGANYGGGNKFCGLLAAKLGAQCNAGRFTTPDGMIWTVPMNAFFNGDLGELITIDVNGNSNPNCADEDPPAACREPDRFTFRVDRYGDITIVNDLARRYIVEQNNTKRASELGR